MILALGIASCSYSNHPIKNNSDELQNYILKEEGINTQIIPWIDEKEN